MSGVLPVFQCLNYDTSYREDYLMCCSINKVIKSLYSDALAHVAVPYPAFTTVLCCYRAGVLERRCGETV